MHGIHSVEPRSVPAGRPFRSSDADSRDAHNRSNAGASGGRSIPAGGLSRPAAGLDATDRMELRCVPPVVTDGVLAAASGVGNRTGSVVDRGVVWSRRAGVGSLGGSGVADGGRRRAG